MTLSTLSIDVACLDLTPSDTSELVNDWILGEFAATGRSRPHVLAIFQSLFRMAGTPIGQAKLARESGLSNNTVAQGYIELLSDLMTIVPAFSYDFDREITVFRKPCKYPFINLLMAMSWHPMKPRTTIAVKNLSTEHLGPIYEWTVAQEIWRRFCISEENDLPDLLNFWQSNSHEIDFVLPRSNTLIEVKAGKAGPMDFIWFLKTFPNSKLTVVSQSEFETNNITGMTLEQFLSQGA